VSILVTGSIAYDTIMVFRDRFKNHLLPDQLHILNVCFVAPEMRREFGGCAGNIAYNLKLLGGEALVFATVGDDIQPYLDRFAKLGIGTDRLKRIPGSFTAQAFITTDLDDNQIIAFHPGAMDASHENRIEAADGAKLAIIAPDGKQGMLSHARQCVEQGIPFVFDPGQGLPMFTGPDIDGFLRQADYVAVNDYEGKMLESKTGRTLEALSREVKALIVTLGAQGSIVFSSGKRHEIPCVAAEKLSDPTGCGDAYRAGLLYGITQGWDWPSTCQLGSVMGAIKIAERGGQNHQPSRDEIDSRYRAAFGYSPWK
jgi:adenosine kinase